MEENYQRKTKVKAIQGMKPPETKKEVRSFLGMIGYYWRFIPHFATKADPLTNLTKKGLPEKIQWNEELDRAFETLKQDLCQTVMLRNPDFTQVFKLQTDASDVGAGAVLSQGRKSTDQSHTLVENSCTKRRDIRGWRSVLLFYLESRHLLLIYSASHLYYK